LAASENPSHAGHGLPVVWCSCRVAHCSSFSGAALPAGTTAKVPVNAAVAESEMPAETHDERQRSRSAKQPILRNPKTLGRLLDGQQRVVGCRLLVIGGDEARSHRALHGAQL